jgi:hypothetical protein
MNNKMQLLNFEISSSQIKKEDSVELILFNLFHHANFIIKNGKYNLYLNLLYFIEDDYEYNKKIVDYKNEILLNLKNTEDDNECVVCYNKTLIRTPNCNHSLCVQCYVQLKVPKCPTCRKCFCCEDDTDEDDINEDE